MFVILLSLCSAEPALDGPRGVYPMYTLHSEGGHVQLCSLPVGAAHWGDSIRTSQTRHCTVIPNTDPQCPLDWVIWFNFLSILNFYGVSIFIFKLINKKFIIK